METKRDSDTACGRKWYSCLKGNRIKTLRKGKLKQKAASRSQ